MQRLILYIMLHKKVFSLSFLGSMHACMVAPLHVLVCVATCSLGEVSRFLKPHEKCLQNFGSLLGDSTQTIYSGEKTQPKDNITIKGKKNKTTTLVFWEKKKSVAVVLDQTTEKFSLF